MNLTQLQKKLVLAARLSVPDDRVPYAFEKRIMAQISASAVVERWVFWTQGLWRAAGACVAVAVVFGAILLFTPVTPEKHSDLSQDFENTLLATVDQGDATMP